MPALYVVATPIGNLEDISLRALRVLKEVKLIAAEDTRHSRRLLDAYEIKTPLTSYHEHNKLSKLDYIIGRLETEDVALVSDAGMPGISDPGHELIVAAHEKGITVVPVPGASAVITAVAISGLPADRFCYVGFLPRKSGERQRLFEGLAEESGSIVCLETPHRLRAALADVKIVLGERQLAICRQLTKRYEEIFRGTAAQALEHFASPRGEFVLIIDGHRLEGRPEMTEEIENELGQMKKEGLAAKEAVALLVAKTGVSRKEIYRAWLKLP